MLINGTETNVSPRPLSTVASVPAGQPIANGVQPSDELRNSRSNRNSEGHYVKTGARKASVYILADPLKIPKLALEPDAPAPGS